MVDAIFVVVEQRPGKGTVGSLLAHDVELLGREQLAPFCLGFVYLFYFLGLCHYGCSSENEMRLVFGRSAGDDLDLD